AEEDTRPTYHEKIRIFAGNGVHGECMEEQVEALRRLCEARETGALILKLKEIVPDYNPSAHVLRSLIAAEAPRERAAAAAAD
ncbi:MAG: hypothetical protein M1436_04060, partial [Acidobacteria bacterium]|nr:hypothetical protein [Acidobacteriota bacterium]